MARIKTSNPKEIFAALEAKIKEATTTDILVGIPAADSTVKDGNTVYLADIATINNFGSQAANIPARPFGSTLMEVYGDKIKKFYQKEVGDSLKGKRPMKQALNRIGFIGAGLMKQNLSAGKWAPNAPITIFGGWMSRGGKSFFVKGKKSAKPLIDKGEMRRAITWVLKKIGGKKDVK